MSLSIHEDDNPKSPGVDVNKTLGLMTCLREKHHYRTDSDGRTLIDLWSHDPSLQVISQQCFNFGFVLVWFLRQLFSV